MAQGANVTIRYCVVCDDVRLEVSTKEILIGVYTAGMRVPSLPFIANICLWLMVVWEGDGALNIEVRILNPRGNQLCQTNGFGRAIFQGRDTSLVFRGLIFSIEMEGEYDIQWRVAGRQWESIRKFPVMRANA